MQLPINYLSQFLDVSDPERRLRSCSITCLAMALRFLNPSEAPTIDDLYSEGEAINALDTDRNWTHVGVVTLARNHGTHAYAEEFRSLRNGEPTEYEARMVSDGIHKIIDALDRALPVVVSVPRKGTGSPHAVLVVGYNREDGLWSGFYVHDPDAEKKEDGEYRWISRDEFKADWRKMAIFFERLV